MPCPERLSEPVERLASLIKEPREKAVAGVKSIRELRKEVDREILADAPLH